MSEQNGLSEGELRILAERTYPGLSPSGMCSRHHPAERINVECRQCFPDVNARVQGWVEQFESIYQAVLSLAGVSDPEDGRHGWVPAVEIIKSELTRRSALDAEVVRVLEKAQHWIVRDPLSAEEQDDFTATENAIYELLKNLGGGE